MSKMTPQIGNYSVKFVWHCTYREDCQWCGSFALPSLKLVLIFAISSVAMLEFNNYQIFHSQAGNVKNQQTVCRKDGQMTWKNRLLVICYVAWFDLISFSENIDFAENISTRKVQSKLFESFFFCLFWLMNGRLWILLAKYLKLWKWPKPLPYMTYGLIFFLLNARGQIVFFPLVFDV